MKYALRLTAGLQTCNASAETGVMRIILRGYMAMLGYWVRKAQRQQSPAVAADKDIDAAEINCFIDDGFKIFDVKLEVIARPDVKWPDEYRAISSIKKIQGWVQEREGARTPPPR